jgi:hypothetical protein
MRRLYYRDSYGPWREDRRSEPPWRTLTQGFAEIVVLASLVHYRNLTRVVGGGYGNTRPAGRPGGAWPGAAWNG